MARKKSEDATYPVCPKCGHNNQVTKNGKSWDKKRQMYICNAHDLSIRGELLPKSEQGKPARSHATAADGVYRVTIRFERKDEHLLKQAAWLASAPDAHSFYKGVMLETAKQVVAQSLVGDAKTFNGDV